MAESLPDRARTRAAAIALLLLAATTGLAACGSQVAPETVAAANGTGTTARNTEVDQVDLAGADTGASTDTGTNAAGDSPASSSDAGSREAGGTTADPGTDDTGGDGTGGRHRPRLQRLGVGGPRHPDAGAGPLRSGILLPGDAHHHLTGAPGKVQAQEAGRIER